MKLPTPETCESYASALLKPSRDYKGGPVNDPGEIAKAAAHALRICAKIKGDDLRAEIDAVISRNTALSSALDDIAEAMRRNTGAALVETIGSIIASAR